MASTSTLTPKLRHGSNLAVSSPSTPTDFLSPASQIRRVRPVVLASQAGTLAENDDATEKQQRQKSRLTSLQSPASMTPKSANRLNSVPESSGIPVNGRAKLTNIQLKDLYSNCLKLSTENKINSKNAFGLQLIDYMQEFLTNVDKDEEVTNFQIASCTLDAGAKIYAGRVDSIHAQAYKMLGGLGRAENSNEDGNEGGESGDPQDQNVQITKKKKSRKSAKVIESNLNNLNTNQFDMHFEVDPLFQKLSATFDEGCTSGLLLNHLIRRDDYCETLFDSKTVPPTTISDFNPGNSQTVDLHDMKDLNIRLTSPTIQICPQYAEFSFTNWDVNAETAKENEISSNETDENAFDMNAPGPAPFDSDNNPNGDVFDDDGDCGGFDDNGIDEGLGVGNPDISSNVFGFANGQEARLLLPGESRPNQTVLPGETDLGTFMLSLQSSENANEYSYSNLAMWAGPAQWRSRAQMDALKGLNKGNSKRKTTTRKKVFRIEFDATHDFKKLFSKGRAGTVLSKTSMDKRASLQKTLPEDLHYEFNNLMKLFLKTKLMIRRQYGPQTTALPDDGNASNWYNYENENDCANFCPAGTQDDDDDVFGSEEVGGFNELSQEMSQTIGSFNNETVFQGDNLVAQPNKVQKIDIAYSKTAKKIDVKKVKRAMWDIISSTSSNADKENMPENTVAEDLAKKSVTKPCNFTDLFHTMPNKISKQMAKNLSIPIAFVCLLHLANEKNLKLEGHASMDDFVITQGV
ncbi:condensin complex subunit 2-like [Dendronephthya gigantea]|uniref:condensin complex subunit 2-like n=1 Tax=Dendronephthya gigantea TaxID=151771 RepID=UPI00106B3068|nr:condensin complex subunit 2-like [Dendronephthya gigantea]